MPKTLPAGASRPTTPRGEATRRNLLAAAELEFGDKGFHAASVSGITGRCGVAQGTFYIYFRSKEEIYRELVRDIGAQLRAAMRASSARGRSRLEAERLGLEGFIAFVSEHPQLYRLVQEAHFVDEEVYREYYDDIAKAYARVLGAAAEAGELRPGDAEVRAWAIMGIGHCLGLRYCLWQGQRPATETFDAVMDFIARGIAPEQS